MSVFDDQRPNSWICHHQLLSVYLALAHHWLRAQGTVHLGMGCHSIRSTQVGCRELPMLKVCIVKYFLRIARNSPELGQWPLKTPILIHLCEQELRYLYSLTDSKAASSRKVSLVISPLGQSSFYLNALSCQKCLVTFAPTFQIPLTLVVSLLYLAVFIFLSDFWVLFSLLKKSCIYFRENRTIDLNEKFIKQTSSLKTESASNIITLVFLHPDVSGHLSELVSLLKTKFMPSWGQFSCGWALCVFWGEVGGGQSGKFFFSQVLFL